MKKIIVKIINNFNKLYKWLDEKDKFGIKRSAKICIISFFCAGIICISTNSDFIKRITIGLFIIELFGLFLIFSFDTKDKKIEKITKGKCCTWRELFKTMSHVSYIFGLVFFTLETSVLVECIIFSIIQIIFNRTYILDIHILIIILMYVYTYLYFSYYIYFPCDEKTIGKVKERIQLYAALMATISFVMLILGENYFFKIYIVGMALEYTWLQYFIAQEENNRNS